MALDPQTKAIYQAQTALLTLIAVKSGQIDKKSGMYRVIYDSLPGEYTDQLPEPEGDYTPKVAGNGMPERKPDPKDIEAAAKRAAKAASKGKKVSVKAPTGPETVKTASA